MVEVKRKKGETFESMLRRFNKRILQSKKIITVKEKQFKREGISRNLRRKKAVTRLGLASKKEYLRKTGKLKEEENSYGRKRY